MTIELDTSGLPILHCRFPARFDEADVADFFDRYNRFLDHADRFVGVFDFSAATITTTPQLRKLASNFIAEANARPVQLSAAAVFVAPNNIWRGAITAILWVAKPRAATHVVASTDEGLSLARFIAEEARL